MYALSCVIIAALLWRWRKLMPEMNLRFHWLAIPSGVGLMIVWLVLGWWMEGELSERWAALTNPPADGSDSGAWSGRLLGDLNPEDEPHEYNKLWAESPILYWASLHLRFVGMVMLVPLFEEVFVRSLCFRMCSKPRETWIGLMQVLEDMPLIGDMLVGSKVTKAAADNPPMFTKQFNETTLSQVTLFGAVASTVIFTMSHVPRDYLGCVACGVVWCAMVWWHNRPALPEHKRLGLGPVIWSHAITNGLLWWYSWGTGDWQFL